MCWAQGSDPSPGCAPAHTAQAAVALLCCCLMCSPPTGSFTLQSCCPCHHLVQHPEPIKAFSSGAPALCFAAGLSPCPSVPGPHNFLAVAAQAGTDEHIPDQLFLVGQDQVPVSISLFPYQAALLSHHSKIPTLLEPLAWPGHECQGSCHSPWEPAHCLDTPPGCPQSSSANSP